MIQRYLYLCAHRYNAWPLWMLWNILKK